MNTEKYKGFTCWSCRRRLRLYGSYKPRPIISDEERFWSKVDQRGPDECWPWKQKPGESSYGYFRLHGKMVRAHRVAWIFTNDEIPEGQVVRHNCDNPPCCNPHHLLLGTQADNVADREERHRRNVVGVRNPRAKLTEDNVRFIKEVAMNERPLAVQFKVSESTIRDIRAGRSWTHV